MSTPVKYELEIENSMLPEIIPAGEYDLFRGEVSSLLLFKSLEDAKQMAKTLNGGFIYRRSPPSSYPTLKNKTLHKDITENLRPKSDVKPDLSKPPGGFCLAPVKTPGDRTITIRNLPADIGRGELDDLFYNYGKIEDMVICDQKRFGCAGQVSHPGLYPPMHTSATITFEDYRDAQDAVRGRNGFNFSGYTLVVALED